VIHNRQEMELFFGYNSRAASDGFLLNVQPLALSIKPILLSFNIFLLAAAA